MKSARKGRLPKSIGLPNAWRSRPRPLSQERPLLKAMGADREVEVPEAEADLPLGSPAEKGLGFGKRGNISLAM